MYNALSVSHYIVDYCNKLGTGISKMKYVPLL